MEIIDQYSTIMTDSLIFSGNLRHNRLFKEQTAVNIKVYNLL
jgi:hypothetical protein